MSGSDFRTAGLTLFMPGAGWLWKKEEPTTGGKKPMANVSATDLARNAQGGLLTIGSPRDRTREGKKLSSFGTSGLRIPNGGN